MEHSYSIYIIGGGWDPLQPLIPNTVPLPSIIIHIVEREARKEQNPDPDIPIFVNKQTYILCKIIYMYMFVENKEMIV